MHFIFTNLFDRLYPGCFPMWSPMQSLMRYSFPVITKAIEILCPAAGPLVEVIGAIREESLRNSEDRDREQIREALHLSTERMDAVDQLLTLLDTRCADLLQRMDQLEQQGRDSTDEVARTVLSSPELQRTFDDLGQRFAHLEGRVDRLDADVQRLDAQYASLGAFAQELQGRMLSETELADFRAFRRAKQLQAEGQFAESEPILRKLADTQTGSAAVAVALAVARHDNPREFDTQLKRAKQLRPHDAHLASLASAATIAVTGRNTPANRSPMDRPMPIQRMPAVGDTLDGWRLEARIGGGGWGIVFRACCNATTKAMKVMQPELVRDPALVKAFKGEVLKMARVNHANVVQVEDYGFCTTFMCHYFVMPLIDGVNLEQHLAKSGPPSPQQAMTWLMGLLDGLEAAHAQGLIHRDIKPQNVMIQPDGRPVLIDFGIAGVVDVPGYTQAIGKSSLFAPPELHSIGQADMRSDLFMLAATIFYALRYDQPLAERAHYQYEDTLVPDVFRSALAAGLATKPSKRPKDVGQMRELLTEKVKPTGPRVEELRANTERLLATSAVQKWVAKRVEGGWDDPGLRRLIEQLHANNVGAFDEPAFATGLTTMRERLRQEAEAKERAEREAAERARVAAESKRKAEAAVKVPKIGDVWTNSVGMPFAYIPAGEFLMGSPAGMGYDDEQPQHRVRISQPFWLGVTPVTNAQWKAVMGSETPSLWKHDQLPVETVSWHDAHAFIKRLNERERGQRIYSLPTEAQWEYACRAGTTTRCFFGVGDSRLGEFAWFNDNSGNQTHHVGEKAANPWGLRDMVGNVWEWCEDWHGPYTADATTDPKGARNGSNRVRRGGSWRDSAVSCRSGYRDICNPAYRFSNLGFRVAVQVR